MNIPDFHIRITNDELTFSAAHFITLGNGECEPLHGHTYRVAAEIFGPLDNCQCVVDFVAVRNALKTIIAELDHRVLLPKQHPAIRVSLQANEVEATFADRRWLFPKNDCLLLPIANTTTEALAQHIAERLAAALKPHGGSINRMQVEVGEGTGCAAICNLSTHK